jgi:PhnB protein
MQIQPYLFFEGRCEEAIRFYEKALGAKDEAQARKLFGALAEGGQVRQPLVKTFFSPAFGMLADRFGVGWMVMVPRKD